LLTASVAAFVLSLFVLIALDDDSLNRNWFEDACFSTRINSYGLGRWIDIVAMLPEVWFTR